MGTRRTDPYAGTLSYTQLMHAARTEIRSAKVILDEICNGLDPVMQTIMVQYS